MDAESAEEDRKQSNCYLVVALVGRFSLLESLAAIYAKGSAGGDLFAAVLAEIVAGVGGKSAGKTNRLVFAQFSSAVFTKHISSP